MDIAHVLLLLLLILLEYALAGALLAYSLSINRLSFKTTVPLAPPASNLYLAREERIVMRIQQVYAGRCRRASVPINAVHIVYCVSSL